MLSQEREGSRVDLNRYRVRLCITCYSGLHCSSQSWIGVPILVQCLSDLLHPPQGLSWPSSHCSIHLSTHPTHEVHLIPPVLSVNEAVNVPKQVPHHTCPTRCSSEEFDGQVNLENGVCPSHLFMMQVCKIHKES